MKDSSYLKFYHRKQENEDLKMLLGVFEKLMEYSIWSIRKEILMVQKLFWDFDRHMKR